MLHDLAELGRAGRELSRVLELLEREHVRLDRQYGAERHGDITAGSPGQTLIGIQGLVKGVGDTLTSVALAVGYISLGLDDRADRAMRTARSRPIGVPSGVDRMARPLGGDTVRALEMISGLDDFFDGSIGLAVEVALAAPEATYPPSDWSAYHQQPLDDRLD